MKEFVLVSVIIPCYNSEDYIDECLLSVLGQSYNKLEIIVVDDGSSDRTVEKVKCFRDSRLRLIEQKNAGACVARNKGLEVANGDYVVFLDSDDWLLEDAVEAQVNFSVGIPHDWIAFGAGIKFYDDDRRVKSSSPAAPDFRYLVRSNITITCSMYPRHALTKLEGFDERLIARQEWNLNIRLFLQGYKFVFSNVLVFGQRMHNGAHRITNRRVAPDVEFESLYAAILPIMEQDDKEILTEVAYKCWSVGRWFALKPRQNWQRYWDLSQSLVGDDSFLSLASRRYRVLVRLFGIRAAELIDRILVRIF